VANTVEAYWEVEGHNLHTWANTIETLSGREGLPPRRGQNEVVAYRAGEVWRPKVFGARNLTLAMWVKGSDANGVIPAAGARAQLRQNIEALKAIFARTDRELVITRRLRTLAPSLLVQTGKAELLGVLEPNFQARDLARLVVDLVMADPFWYGAQQTVNITLADGTIVNDGSYYVTKMKVRFKGPLTNPQLVNQSMDPVVSLSYVGTIGAGNWIEFDTDAFTARDQGGLSVLGSTSHSGAREWMVLRPAANAMVLNAEAGTGSVDVTFSPAYL